MGLLVELKSFLPKARPMRVFCACHTKYANGIVWPLQMWEVFIRSFLPEARLSWGTWTLYTKYPNGIFGAVAQLARASHLQWEGRRFESDQLHHRVDYASKQMTIFQIVICLFEYTNLNEPYISFSQKKGPITSCFKTVGRFGQWNGQIFVSLNFNNWITFNGM